MSSAPSPLPPPAAPAPPPAPPSDEAAEAPRRRVRLRDVVWPVLLSLAVIVGILTFTTDGEELARVARQFRPGLLALAVGALVLQVGAAAVRLRHIAQGMLTLRQAVRAQISWDFLSSITPSALGGGPFAAVLISRENKLPLGRVSALMLFSMLMDQVWFATLIVALFGLATVLPVFPTALGAASIGTVVLYLVGLLAWIAFFATATLFRPDLIEWAAQKVVRIKWLRRFEGFVMTETTKLKRQAKILRGQPLRFYAVGFGLTMVVWCSRYAIALYSAYAVASIARPVLFYFRTAALWLVGLVMPTPGGSGGMEGLYLLFLAPLLPEGTAGAALLGWRMIAYYLVLVVGAFVAGTAVRELFFGGRKDA